MDPSSDKNLAYKLNQLLTDGKWTAYVEGTGTKEYTFPSVLNNYIKDHEWFIEAGNFGGYAPADYTVTSKLSVLSRTEWAKYYTVIGTKPTGARFNQTWMRTGSGNTAQTVTIAVNGGVHPGYASGKTRAINGAAKSKNDVRPCFYLDKTYFAENKIDVSSAGDEVKKFIRENYAREDMENIYDISEMVRLGYSYDGLLEVSDVTLTMGDDSITPVTVSYTWNSETTEYGSTYDWYVSADGTNNWTKVTTTTVKEYNIRATDGGKYLKCIVTPKDEDFNPSMPA